MVTFEHPLTPICNDWFGFLHLPSTLSKTCNIGCLHWRRNSCRHLTWKFEIRWVYYDAGRILGCWCIDIQLGGVKPRKSRRPWDTSLDMCLIKLWSFDHSIASRRSSLAAEMILIHAKPRNCLCAARRLPEDSLQLLCRHIKPTLAPSPLFSLYKKHHASERCSNSSCCPHFDEFCHRRWPLLQGFCCSPSRWEEL